MPERKAPKRVWVLVMYGGQYVYRSKRDADLDRAALSRFNDPVLGPYRYDLHEPKPKKARRK